MARIGIRTGQLKATGNTATVGDRGVLQAAQSTVDIQNAREPARDAPHPPSGEVLFSPRSYLTGGILLRRIIHQIYWTTLSGLLVGFFTTETLRLAKMGRVTSPHAHASALSFGGIKGINRSLQTSTCITSALASDCSESSNRSGCIRSGCASSQRTPMQQAQVAESVSGLPLGENSDGSVHQNAVHAS